VPSGPAGPATTSTNTQSCQHTANSDTPSTNNIPEGEQSDRRATAEETTTPPEPSGAVRWGTGRGHQASMHAASDIDMDRMELTCGTVTCGALGPVSQKWPFTAHIFPMGLHGRDRLV
jgi:hypothetical protein